MRFLITLRNLPTQASQNDLPDYWKRLLTHSVVGYQQTRLETSFLGLGRSARVPESFCPKSNHVPSADSSKIAGTAERSTN